METCADFSRKICRKKMIIFQGREANSAQETDKNGEMTNLESVIFPIRMILSNLFWYLAILTSCYYLYYLISSAMEHILLVILC